MAPSSSTSAGCDLITQPVGRVPPFCGGNIRTAVCSVITAVAKSSPRWVLSLFFDQTHRTVHLHPTAVGSVTVAVAISVLRWVSSPLRCTFPYCGGFGRIFPTEPTAQRTTPLLRWQYPYCGVFCHHCGGKIVTAEGSVAIFRPNPPHSTPPPHCGGFRHRCGGNILTAVGFVTTAVYFSTLRWVRSHFSDRTHRTTHHSASAVGFVVIAVGFVPLCGGFRHTIVGFRHTIVGFRHTIVGFVTIMGFVTTFQILNQLPSRYRIGTTSCLLWS